MSTRTFKWKSRVFVRQSEISWFQQWPFFCELVAIQEVSRYPCIYGSLYPSTKSKKPPCGHIVITIKGTVRQKKPFNKNNDFITCEIMFIMCNKIMHLLKWPIVWERGPVRSRAGRPRSAYLIFTRFSVRPTWTIARAVHTCWFTGAYCSPLTGSLTRTMRRSSFLINIVYIIVIKLKSTSPSDSDDPSSCTISSNSAICNRNVMKICWKYVEIVCHLFTCT